MPGSRSSSALTMLLFPPPEGAATTNRQPEAGGHWVAMVIGRVLARSYRGLLRGPADAGHHGSAALNRAGSALRVSARLRLAPLAHSASSRGPADAGHHGSAALNRAGRPFGSRLGFASHPSLIRPPRAA